MEPLFHMKNIRTQNTIEKEKVYRVAEDWFMKKSGELFPVSYVASPIFENDYVTGAIIVFRDISKQKADKERIEYMAFHDDLTKLPNLRYIKEKLTKDMLKHQSLARSNTRYRSV